MDTLMIKVNKNSGVWKHWSHHLTFWNFPMMLIMLLSQVKLSYFSEFPTMFITLLSQTLIGPSLLSQEYSKLIDCHQKNGENAASYAPCHQCWKIWRSADAELKMLSVTTINWWYSNGGEKLGWHLIIAMRLKIEILVPYHQFSYNSTYPSWRQPQSK